MTRTAAAPGNVLTAVVASMQIAITVAGTVFLQVWPSALPSVAALSVSLAFLLAWCLVSWVVLRQEIFHPYVLFLFSAFLFNAGQPLLEVVATSPNGILGGEFSVDVLRRTLALVFVGLSGLHCGAVTRLALGANSRLETASSDGNQLRTVGWALVIVSIPAATVWLSQGVAIVSAGGYVSMYERELSSGIDATPFLLGNLLITGCLFLVTGGRRHRADAGLGAFLLFVFVTVQFYMGFRSTAAMPLIAWAWLRHRAVRAVSAPALVCGALLLLCVVFPVVRETRNLSSLERSIASVAASFGTMENPAVTSVEEMGQSMGTVAHTLVRVPGTRPFDMGEGYAYAFLTVLPNLFWSIHPTIARGTNSEWLASAVNISLAQTTAAYGYSPIAEAYSSFGIIGVPIVMASFGFLLVMLVVWAEGGKSLARLGLVAVVMAFALRFPRDELSGVLRPLVWYGLVPYLAAVTIPHLNRHILRARSTKLNNRRVVGGKTA